MSDSDRQMRQMAFQTAARMGGIMVMEPFASRIIKYLIKTPVDQLQPEPMAGLSSLIVPRLIHEMDPVLTFMGVGMVTGNEETAARILALYGPGIGPYILPSLTTPAGGKSLHGMEAFVLALAGAKDAQSIRALQKVYADPAEQIYVRRIAGAALGKLETLPPDEIALVNKTLAEDGAEADTIAAFAVSLLPASAHPAILPAVQKLAAAEGSNGGLWADILPDIR